MSHIKTLVTWPALIAVFSVSWLLVLATGSEAMPWQPNCFPDRLLSTGESAQISLLSTHGTAFVTLEVPVVGELVVEVAGEAGAHAWVELLSSSCDGSTKTTDRVVVRENSLSRKRLEIFEPGEYSFRIGLVDPDQTPSAVYFTSGMLFRELFDRDGEDGDETEEIDVQIQPLTLGEPCSLDHDGEDGDETEEIDVQIQPLETSAPSCEEEAGEVVLAEGLTRFSCGGEPANDLIWCAQRVQVPGSVLGELNAAQEVDHDYFTFRLPENRVIRLFTTGSMDTAVTLFDAQGQPLQFVDKGGDGENFSFLASLPAGAYFLRVAGVLGAVGDYTLRLAEEMAP